MSKSGISRYSTRRDVPYHKTDRAKNKILVRKWEYGKLPSKESMRKAIWRGPNCWGDLTSFGEYNSRSHRYEILERMLDKYIGKSFDEYYSVMCRKFKGYDRVRFEWFVDRNFKTAHGYRFSYVKYEVVNGLIMKN